MKKQTKQQAAEAEWRLSAASGIPAPTSSAYCPVRTTLNVLGGKWKLLILSYLIDGPQRYGELRRLAPDITEKMLIQELRELETDGIVTRLVYQQVPPKVEYMLTEHGQAVLPVMQALVNWGNNYLARDASTAQFVTQSYLMETVS